MTPDTPLRRYIVRSWEPSAYTFEDWLNRLESTGQVPRFYRLVSVVSHGSALRCVWELR